MFPMGLNLAIKQRALDIGFDLAGIAPADGLKDLEFARDWVERGFGGEMKYLANPKRFDPRRVLPSVKSVLCVGVIYNTPYPYSTEVHSEGVRSRDSEVRSQESEDSIQSSAASCSGQRTTRDGPPPVSSFEFQVSNFQLPVSQAAEPRAWISRYAWGRDYHRIMREKLKCLRAAIEELAPGVEARVYVDTGPVVERAFARHSGIGWMGKNTCIINEEKGSWFFLGVILTNLALEPDLPAPDRCGTCRACLDACPTGALLEPYVMDARRCISYLTIELKGSIPRELRTGVGVNIFGCDICQDVCPWNAKGRFQVSGARCQERSFEPMAVSYQQSAVSHQTTGNLQSSIVNHQSSAPSPQHLAPSTFSLFAPLLEALALLTEGDFRKLFAHSPISRAKYRGWLRNLSVAMGNSGDARFIPWLEQMAHGDDPALREHAEWALERIPKVESDPHE